eukprot:364433-Chlamydomonas_euryale.AAC.10
MVRLSATTECLATCFVPSSGTSQHDRACLLPAAEFAISNFLTFHASTGITPFRPACGQDPWMPLLVVSTAGLVCARVAKSHNDWAQTLRAARQHTQAAQQHIQAYHDVHCRHVTFNVGGKALLSTRTLNCGAGLKRGPRSYPQRYWSFHGDGTGRQGSVPLGLASHHVSLAQRLLTSACSSHTFTEVPINHLRQFSWTAASKCTWSSASCHTVILLAATSVKGPREYLVKWSAHYESEAT